ncbi:hypothetical protein [Longimicrobium sp.]|uniref:hypothetical protein n=1 Tax=Longimicrobium sp. TaxID=2029185 RepID=UPI002E355A6A|nr:hypothetical protein [Longimicrobium sp.]HEX6040443.1 hypothetical protein [Longimicrobium sp.]
MSLLAFQRAMADLAASPALRARVRDDAESALAPYTLTDLERRRLASAAGQPGMRVNGMLYRSNRLGPIAAQLPYSFVLIGPALRGLMDAYWERHPGFERNAPLEVRRFADFLRERMEAGDVAEPLLREVLDWEMLVYELALLPPERTLAQVADAAANARADGPLRPHPLVGVTPFSVDPRALLPHLFAKRRPPYDDVEEGEHHLLVDLRGARRAFVPLDPSIAAAFHAVRDGGWVDQADAEMLIELGIVVAGE